MFYFNLLLVVLVNMFQPMGRRLIFWSLQVHMCNKLASRHVRVGLASPSDVPRCDICENAPGTQFPLSVLVVFL